MNKPLTLLCAVIAGAGLLTLAAAGWHAVWYGRGDLDAGNFHRNRYWTERDQDTGKKVRRWEMDYERAEGTDASPLAQVDTWTVGIVLIVFGAAIWVCERHYRSKGHF